MDSLVPAIFGVFVRREHPKGVSYICVEPPQLVARQGVWNNVALVRVCIPCPQVRGLLLQGGVGMESVSGIGSILKNNSLSMQELQVV